MQDESFPLPKIFSITRNWRKFLLICPLASFIFAIGAVWMILTLNQSNNATYSMVVALLGLCLAFILMWGYFDYSKSRLALTSDGITYYSSGFRIYTPWHNLADIGSISPQVPLTVSWTSKLIGFRLRQNAMLRMKLEEGVRQGIAVIETDWWYPVSMRAPYAGFFIIDEIIRERNWQQSDLGIYLQHYAPQAFEELDFLDAKQKERLSR
jgi:hypothetical protein